MGRKLSQALEENARVHAELDRLLRAVKGATAAR